MRLEAEVEGRDYKVEVERRGGELFVVLDGRALPVDARVLEGFFTSILVYGKAYEVTVEPEADSWRVQVGIDIHRVKFADPLRPARQNESERVRRGIAYGIVRGRGGRLVATALMPGKVSRVLVEPGEEVEEGQGLLVIEAMKMENEVPAPAAGRVLEVKVRAGEPVEAGAPLVVLG